MIIYDNIVYMLQKVGGISTYWGELSSRLLRDKKDVIFLESQSYNNSNIVRRTLNINDLNLVKYKSLPITLNRFLRVRISKNKEKFIFHSSYNRITRNPKALQVLTIHDFVHEKYYKGLRRFLHSYQKNKAIHVADRIIVVSENTKNDLLEMHPEINSKIVRVIHNGVSEDFYEISFEKKIATENKPYLVFIGSREKYKNFDFAVEVLSRMTEFDLYIIGGELNEIELRMLNEKLKDRWKLFSRIANQELNIIYNHAHALLYPSSYEGFGIPLLEAMKAGTPFVALNKSSIPEVAGKAGILLNDLDLEGFELAINSIKTNREDLKARGFSQAKKFSWEKCFQETIKVYSDLLNS